MDDYGKPVAWWSALKFPTGTSYQYADANYPSLVKSPNQMSDPVNGALSQTIKQIYAANATYSWTDYGFVFYNDERPDGTGSGSRGHTKGVVRLTQAGAFWLIHSVPAFPPWMNQGYNGYAPPASTTYAQSFLCITLAVPDFNLVGLQFYYNFPQYYDWNMPSWVPQQMIDSVTKSSHTTAAASNVVTFTPPSPYNTNSPFGNVLFTSFAKTSNWGQELYEFLVAPYWNSDLYVETWMDGTNPQPTFCINDTIQYNVMNVRNLTTAWGVDYPETKDHSKWCVVTHNLTDILCIGDINRQQSQATRGGGTCCFKMPQLWTDMTNMIWIADQCPPPPTGLEYPKSHYTQQGPLHADTIKNVKEYGAKPLTTEVE